MKRKSLFINVFYAFMFQFTNVVFPLITAPYISRVIGAEGIGKVNFSTSVVGWFVLIATYGTMTYGVKEVAKLRDDRIKLECFLGEMVVLKLVLTAVVSMLYLLCVIFVKQLSKEWLLFAVQGITLLLNVFSIDWFFQGVEDYAYIGKRSIMLKTISLFMLFLLIKEKQDYLIYAGISIFALSFSNILSFFYARRYARFRIKGLELKRHLKPLTTFFLSSMVVSVYNLLDQVILGFLSGEKDVALFVRAKMIFLTGISFAITIDNIIMPRLNNYFVNNKERYSELLQLSKNILLMVTIPLVAGVTILAKNIMFLLGGSEFVPAADSLIILAPLLVIVPLATWNYQQRILPLGLEKVGLKIHSIMAFISIIANFLLIPMFGFVGAAVSYCLAEIVGVIIGFAYVKKKDGLRLFNTSQFKYLLGAAGMIICLSWLQRQFDVSWLAMLIYIIVGGIIYFVLLLGMKERVILHMLKMTKLKLFSKTVH